MGTVHVCLKVHGENGQAHWRPAVVVEARLGREIPAQLAVNADDQLQMARQGATRPHHIVILRCVRGSQIRREEVRNPGADEVTCWAS